MKKSFFILMLFVHNVITTCNNCIHFKVNQKNYTFYATIENFYIFIGKLISWHQYQDEHYTVQSSNSDTKKELKISFNSDKNYPVKITYWRDNSSNNSDFKEESLWDDLHVPQIDNIFYNQTLHCTKTQKEHFNFLQKMIHCKVTSSANFIPKISPRIDQSKQTNPRIHYVIQPLAGQRRAREEEIVTQEEAVMSPALEITPFSVPSFESRSLSPTPKNPSQEE